MVAARAATDCNLILATAINSSEHRSPILQTAPARSRERRRQARRSCLLADRDLRL